MHAWLRTGSRPRRLVKLLALMVTVSVVLPGTAFGVVLSAYLFLPLPTALPDELPQVASQISTVHAVDGAPIGEFREAEQAIPVDAEEIPDTIRRAVIAAEDDDFFSHDGVDFEAVGRALFANLTAGRIVQGGSTISQQLVKNLYTGRQEERTFLVKAQEALLAAQVERKLSKGEILARYLNTIYLGDSTFGIEAASRSYFRKPASELSLSEAALLAGLVPAPSRFSPRTHPDAAEARRQFVLDRLESTGLASPEEVQAARAEQPTIHPPPGVEGRYPYFLDYVRRHLLEVEGLTPEQVFRGGLRIETTLTPDLQDRAREVVLSTLPDPEDPEGSLVAVEPQTGFVRALVGGRDWERNKVNLALGAFGGGTGRQAGSSFKPFVLAKAFEAGLKPSTTYSGPACKQVAADWRPCNYGNSSFGTLTLRRATQSSVNTVFAELIVDVGVDEVAALAHRLGIRTISPEVVERQQIGGSLALGVADVSPLDMASAFSAFAARGVRAQPTPVVRVTTPDGEVLVDHTEPERERVLDEVVADNVNDVLEGVIEHGTARAADIGRPAAGKTGTEDDNTDAWFVGYTPTLSTAVWMGHLEGQIPMHDVHGVSRVTGGSHPARMWASFMERALEGVPETEFNEPAPLDSLEEQALREQRGGFALGDRRYGAGPPAAGPFYEPPPEPEAGTPPEVEPTTTTSSTSTTTTSTSTSTTTTTTEPGIVPSESSSSSSSTTTTTEPDDGDDEAV